MAKKRRLEFFLLRYVPCVLRDEFINIGIVLLDPAALRRGFCEARFIDHWEELESFDDDADIEVLRAITSDIERQLKSPASRSLFLRMMEASFSNTIQISKRKKCVTSNPAREVESLARRFLLRTKKAA